MEVRFTLILPASLFKYTNRIEILLLNTSNFIYFVLRVTNELNRFRLPFLDCSNYSIQPRFRKMTFTGDMFDVQCLPVC